jgi:hypothetical protein
MDVREDDDFHPWRIDNDTDTIWYLIAGEWTDSGETPDAIVRFMWAVDPQGTPLLDLLKGSSDGV